MVTITSNSKKTSELEPINWVGLSGLIGFILISIGRLNEYIPGLTAIPTAKLALLFMLLGLVVGEKNKSTPFPRLSKKDHKKLAPEVKIAVLWYVFFIVLGTVLSTGHGRSIEYLINDFSTSFALYYFTVRYCNSLKVMKLLFATLIFSGLLNAVIIILSSGSGARVGIHGTYDPNDSAAIFVTILPLVIFFIRSRENMSKYFFVGIFSVLLLGVLFTQSRGGLVGLVLSVAYYFMFSGGGVNVSKVVGRLVVLGMSIILIGSISLSFVSTDARDRLLSIFDLENDYNVTDEGRFGLWGRGVNAIGEKPWGWGLGQYRLVDYRMGGRYKTAHNMILQAAVEVGVLGGLALAWIFMRGRKSLVKAIDDEDEHGRLISMSLGASLAGFFVCGMFLSFAYSNLMFLLFGLSQYWLANSNKNKAESLNKSK